MYYLLFSQMPHRLFTKLFNECSFFSCNLLGFGLQAQKHLALAKEMLPLWCSCREEKLEVLTCLLSIHLTHGAACVITAKYPDFF